MSLRRFRGRENLGWDLVGGPEIKGIADLKGKTVSVDALTTGYAFVLLDLLKRAGLNQADSRFTIPTRKLKIKTRYQLNSGQRDALCHHGLQIFALVMAVGVLFHMRLLAEAQRAELLSTK
jgi:hypothetical protein